MRCLSAFSFDPLHIAAAAFVFLFLLVAAFTAGALWGAPEIEP